MKHADTAKLQEIKDYGWGVISDPRKHRSGGGIAVIFNKNLRLKTNMKVTKYKSCQVMETLLETNGATLRLVNVYRPPYTKKARYTECCFLEEFSEYLCDLSCKPGTPIIGGDFNIHVERPEDRYPEKFLALLNQYGLQQCVPHVPTHNLGGTLDLLITTEEFRDGLGPISVVESGTSSDHFLVRAEVSASVSPSSDDTRKVSYRDFNKIVVDDFRSDILESDLCKWDVWCTASIEDAVLLYNKVLWELMDSHCPVIRKTVRGRDRPWMDAELRALQRKRRAAERAWRKGKGSHEDYVKLRNSFCDLESKKRCSYNRKALLASAGDTKSLFKKVQKLTGEDTQQLPSSKNTKNLANDFKDFFAAKVNIIRSSIEEEGKEAHGEEEEDDEDSYRGPKFEGFNPITKDNMLDYISNMSNKFCSLDPIPTFLLKRCSRELAPILLHIANCSLMQGEFPNEMKTAIVKPTLKKKDADPDCLKNYRPVSNLPVLSKLLERIVLDQLNHHLQENTLHCPVQSGYRPNHSCETLLVRMMDDIFKEIHADNIVIVVLLDLSAAFDTIDHGILLKKLMRDFGITGTALSWLKSYLKDRFFGVKVGDSLSDLLCLLFGVPQGSLLGPILFILYIKQLQRIAENYGLMIQLYADDSQLYISFHPKRPTELQDVMKRINACLLEVKSWMIRNFMKLNDGKTELLVIGKPLVLRKFDLEVKIQFGDTAITPTICEGDSWKSLGVLLDGSLSMERQINSIKQKCWWTMTNLRTIRHYLDEKVKLMLIKQLVISKLDYCNALYMNLPKGRLNKLRSILNGGIRFIYDVTDRDVDLTPYYKKAHILPVEQRIFFKVCLLCFKIVNGTAPPYLQELVTLNDNDPMLRESRLRPANDVQMKLPKFSKLKASNRRFTYFAPEAWNSLPSRLRVIDRIAVFKVQLKSFLYDRL